MDTRIRDYQLGDKAALYYVCLKTGDHGKDGEPFYEADPDALGRAYVGPYLEFAPDWRWYSKMNRACAATRWPPAIRERSLTSTSVTGGPSWPLNSRLRPVSPQPGRESKKSTISTTIPTISVRSRTTSIHRICTSTFSSELKGVEPDAR